MWSEGAGVTDGKATTKILNKGKSKVIDVKDSALGLKKGNEVNMVFNYVPIYGLPGVTSKNYGGSQGETTDKYLLGTC